MSQIQNDTRNTPPPGNQVNGNSDSDEIQNTFIQLMVAQIRNQDPTKPVDSSEFLSQFASMSQVQSLEKMSALTQNNMVLLENLQYLSAASLVGQMVKVRVEELDLTDQKVEAQIELEHSANELVVTLTDENGVETQIPLPASAPGRVEFEIDPVALGLKPGKYEIEVKSNTDETFVVEAKGKVNNVRLSSDGPVLNIAGVGDVLRSRLAQAAKGEAFLLQGGDCAETFEAATADKISARVKTILQMAVVLTYGAQLPVIKMGRMAGQFAKPRSSNDETRDGVTLPAYRGDIVNGYDFTPESREHDPSRMLKAYHTSASTLNLIRAFTQGGFADLRSVHEWNRGFTSNPAHSRYEQLAKEIDSAIKFMASCGADFDALKTVEFFASHEALLLDYERALTRIDSRTGLPYDTSAHFLWIGERTRDLDQAHVDFLSRVRNPIGVKLGPTTSPDDALRLIDKLDPNREPGRLTFITRMGATNIREKLPNLVEKVTASGAQVLWVTDPMHGNTVTSPNGYKTRNFDDVIDEVRGFFEVHEAQGTVPGGLHVEMTGDDVAECLGGADPIDQEAFLTGYESVCDPRLNHKQSLEMAFLVSEGLRKNK